MINHSFSILHKVDNSLHTNGLKPKILCCQLQLCRGHELRAIWLEAALGWIQVCGSGKDLYYFFELLDPDP